MARPKKKGLSYFPFDVDIFEDDKMFDVQIKYGPLGEVIYLRLLCLIYKNGYYYKFESLDKVAAILIKSIGSRWVRDKETVKDVISFLAECNLFSAELMQENILTSRGIQLPLNTATERRQSHIHEYSLLEKNDFQVDLESVPKNQVSATQTDVSATETQVYVDDNPTKESKGNKRKGKQSKVVVEIPTIDGIYRITERQLQQLQQQYTNIEVIKCLRRIESYMCLHPNKRQVSRFMDKYITGWILDDINAGKYQRTTSGAAYDLEAYERMNPFKDMEEE